MAVPKYVTPWWANLAGGQEAADQMTQFSLDPSLASAWRIANQTRLHEHPEIASAVMSSDMDYATARRLDSAFQATAAQKQRNIATDAGISSQMVSPHVSNAASAADAAAAQLPAGVPQGSRVATPQDSTPPVLGASNPISKGLGFADQGLGDLIKPAVNAVGPTVQHGFDLGKTAFEKLLEALNRGSSIIKAPAAAGRANLQGAPAQALEGKVQEGWLGAAKDYVGSFESGALGIFNAVKNFGQGIGEIAGLADLSDPQKQDMRRAGYNPDEWTSRYAYYFDETKHTTHLAPDSLVKQAKQEFNPYKVDLAREAITSGVFDNIGRASGLSPDTQKFLMAVQRNEDPEGSQILNRFRDRNAVSIGANLAEVVPSMRPGTGAYDAVSIVGDLAAYWYLDPLMVAGRALQAYRVAKYGVDVSSDSVRSAIAETKDGTVDSAPLTKIGQRWDDVIDRIDRIHLLRQQAGVGGENAEAANNLAREVATFQQRHEDLMPFYDTLVGMRQGSIQGSFFSPARGKSFADPDQMSPIGLRRVVDEADYAPMFKLRKTLADDVSQATRNEARASVAELMSDTILANALADGRPLVKGQLILPGSIGMWPRLKSKVAAVEDAVMNQRGKLLDQLADAEGRATIDFAKDMGPSADGVVHVIASPEGGKWLRENYTPGQPWDFLRQESRGGLGSRLAMSLSRMDTMRNAALLTYDGSDSVQTFSRFVRFFMPRGQTAYLTDAWAVADPARRKIMLEGLFNSIAEARPVLQTPAAKDFWRQQLRGAENAVNPGGRTMQAYSTPATDLIDTPSGKFAAGMYSTQFSQGVQLPSFIDVVKNTEKVGVLSWLSGVSNTRFVQQFSRAVKNGYIGTISHMLRHANEARAYQWMETPDLALKTTKVRFGVAGEVSAQRAEFNDLVRQAKGVLSSGRMDEIEHLAVSDRDEYIRQISQVVRDETGSEPMAALTQLLARDTLDRAGTSRAMNIQDIARLRGSLRLGVARPIDYIRRVRAGVYGRIGGDDVTGEAAAWYNRALAGTGDKYREGISRQLSGSRDEYAHGGSGVINDIQQMDDGQRAGQRMLRMKLDNTWGYLGVAGDTGAARWADALGRRLADPVGIRVIHAVAGHALDTAEDIAANSVYRAYGLKPPAELTGNGIRPAMVGLFRDEAGELPEVLDLWQEAAKVAEAVHPKGFDRMARAEELLNQRDAAIKAYVDARLAETQDIKTPEAFAHWLLTQHESGEAYRQYGMRGKYVAGESARTPEQIDQAMQVWAKELTDDASYYLGLKRTGLGEHTFDESQRAMIERVARHAEPIKPMPLLLDDVAPTGAANIRNPPGMWGDDPNPKRKGWLIPLAQDPAFRSAMLEREAAANKPAVDLDTLASVPDKFRPETVQAPIIIGKKFVDLSPDGVMQAIVDLSNKAYRFTVSGPLERLVHDPQVIAVHHEIMAAQAPLAAELTARGLSPATVYETLEANAYRHAIARVVRYSDNPRTQTYFSLLSNNLLFFERAVEDFFRRFVMITKADPATLARAHLMVEAGLHSGLLYHQKGKDDEGHEVDEMMFTWPGSGLMARAINESAIGLGLTKSEVIKNAVWQDYASPVRMMHPAIDNPVGFSSSPMIGAALRVLRDGVFPQEQLAFDRALTTLEGGARSFGTQTLLESIMPIYGKRLVNLLDADPNAEPGMLMKGRDGQVASAVRNSMIYLQAAGKIPSANATPTDLQHAQDELRQQAVNNLFLRAVLSTFSPVAAGMGVTDVNDIGQQNTVDQLRGVRSVRGEWFQLLEDMTKKYDGNTSRALSEANVEWIKRNHGSVINPEAFTVGATRAPGKRNQDKSIASNLPTTQWMLDNTGFLQKYGEVAYRLIPALGHDYYDTVGYRTQLRTELRQHKGLDQFYEDLIYAQASQKYYAAKTVRDELLAGASDKAATNAIYNQWSAFEKNLEVADPVWAKLRAERDVPGRVHADLAPALHRIAADPQLPPELEAVRPQIAVMAKLYDDYRSAYTQIPGTNTRAGHARQIVNTLYHKQGDTLFAAPVGERQAEDVAKKYPLDGLWRSMRVYER